MRKYYPAKQWRAWFVEFESSGLTVAKFCLSIGVSVQTFYKWRQRLKESSPTTADVGRSCSDASSRFASVSLVPRDLKRLPGNCLEITLPGGATVHIPNDYQSLRPILEVLHELGAGS